MAGTIDPTQVKQLIDSLNSLTKALGGSAASGGYSTQKTGYDNYKNGDKGGGLNTEALRSAIKNNGDAAQQLGNMFKKMSLASKGLDKVFDTLEKNTRKLNDQQRQATLSIVDMMNSSKDFVKTLDQLDKRATKASESIEKHKDAVDALKTATGKLTDLELKRAAVEANIAKARKAKKKTSDLQATLDEINKTIEEQKTSVEGLNKEFKDITQSFIDLNETTGALNEADLEYLKNVNDINTSNEDYIKIMKKVNGGVAQLQKTNDTIAKSLVDTAKTNGDHLTKGVLSLKNGLVKAGKMLFTEAIPIAFNDYMARMKNNIPESGYGSSLLLGVSESDRSNLIGGNRQNLRSLGNGNAAGGFDNQLASLQKSAYQFGVYGKDALEAALAYQKTSMGVGIRGNDVEGQKLQMSLMHQFSEQIGVTDGALKDFYDSLQDMGELAVLNQKYADKSEIERSKAINKEIFERTRLNAALGISIEQQKQMQQDTVNSKFAGVRAAIMGQISQSVTNDQYGPKAGSADRLLLDKYAAASNGGDEGVMRQLAIQHGDGDRVNKLLNDKAARILKARTDATEYTLRTGNNSKQLGLDAQNDIFGMTGYQTEKNSITGSKLGIQAQALGQDSVGTKTFDQALSDATKSLNGPEGLELAAIKAAQALTGIKGNPIGAATSGLLQTAGGFLLGSAARSAGGAAINAIGSGVAGSTIGALGKTVGAIGTSSVGSLATGGAAGVGTIAAGVAIAGAIGYGIGTAINKTLIEGTKTGDAIGSAMARIAGFFGSDAAQQAIQQNKDYDASHAKTQARTDELNAVTAAQKLAVTVKGTSGQGMAVSKAEELRANYKAKYGVDLSGGGVGYTSLVPNTDTTSSVSALGANSPTTLINKQVADQINAEAAAGHQDKVQELLEQIAKSNKEMNERDGKEAAKDQVADASKMGSIYASYNKHLQEQTDALRSSV